MMMSWLHDLMIWLMLVYTGVITTALTVYMETVAVKTLSAAETTLIFSAEPVFGSAFAAIMLSERFGMDAFAGAFLILCGCLVSNLGLDGMTETLMGTSTCSSSSTAAGEVHCRDNDSSSSSSSSPMVAV
jgi:threonine/homoserine efflux transporter RhtA